MSIVVVIIITSNTGNTTIVRSTCVRDIRAQDCDSTFILFSGLTFRCLCGHFNCRARTSRTRLPEINGFAIPVTQNFHLVTVSDAEADVFSSGTCWQTCHLIDNIRCMSNRIIQLRPVHVSLLLGNTTFLQPLLRHGVHVGRDVLVVRVYTNDPLGVIGQYRARCAGTRHTEETSNNFLGKLSSRFGQSQRLLCRIQNCIIGFWFICGSALCGSHFIRTRSFVGFEVCKVGLINDSNLATVGRIPVILVHHVGISRLGSTFDINPVFIGDAFSSISCSKGVSTLIVQRSDIVLIIFVSKQLDCAIFRLGSSNGKPFQSKVPGFPLEG